MEKQGKSYAFIKELNTMLNSRISTWVITNEEERFLRLLRRIAKAHQTDNNFAIYSWSITEGLLNMMPSLIENEKGLILKPIEVTTKPTTNITDDFNIGEQRQQTSVPVKTFDQLHQYINNNQKGKLYIIKDFHNFLTKDRVDYPINLRRLKEMIFSLRENGGYLIFLTPKLDIPLDIENDVHILDMPRPDDIDIEELLNFAICEFKKIRKDIEVCIDYVNEKGKITKSKHLKATELKQKFIFNLRGLTETEITQILCYTCVKHIGLTETALDEIRDSKKEKIARFEFLEFIPTPDEICVGGHKDFKQYIDQRGLYLNQTYRDKFHLQPPKGALVNGVPGSGKSHMARYIGWKWGIPIIRLDMGALFSKWVGDSEGNLRSALKMAEANAPCILWIDEIEKAISGSKSSNDSGTTARVFGKLLTWMSERTEMVYLYCTANNIDNIPSELLRAGRLDTIRWADLPNEEECREIVDIHLKENCVDINPKALPELVNLMLKQQMTGAEIKNAIIEANFKLACASKEMGTDLPMVAAFFESAIKETKSWALTHKEQLFRCRKTALENYEFTSKEIRTKIEKEIGDEEARKNEFN